MMSNKSHVRLCDGNKTVFKEQKTQFFIFFQKRFVFTESFIPEVLKELVHIVDLESFIDKKCIYRRKRKKAQKIS